jgi:hypothetical protein
VISALELALLLRGSDRDDQLDAIENLLECGLVSAVINGDAITCIRTTTAGDCALRVVTMPKTNE